jgi:hypothetical protein
MEAPNTFECFHDLHHRLVAFFHRSIIAHKENANQEETSLRFEQIIYQFTAN